MDNQRYNIPQSTYGRGGYIPKLEPNGVILIPISEQNRLVFQEEKDYIPTLLLLESIIKAREDLELGNASPTFSSVEEMEKWLNEQDE